MEVKIKKIEQGRFASFYGFGKQPEEEAMNKLLKWCQKRNINIDDSENVIYGFNNPNPVPGSFEYGYEFWFKVGINERPEGDVRIIEFHGGNYAAVECIGVENIFQTWQNLFKWCKENNYRMGYHQALERIIDNVSDINNVRVELCCPIILN